MVLLVWAVALFLSFRLALAGEIPTQPVVAVPDPQPEVRRLHLRHHWLRETLEVVYRIGDQYQPEAMAQINHFMRDWHCNKAIVMDPKLIDRLYEIQKAIGDRYTIRLISGYRSEGYNASLLAAGRSVDPSSEHMQGKAADIFVQGVPAQKIKDAAEGNGPGGVGYYPFSGPRFVHVDSGPDRHWTEMDPSVRRRLGLMRRQQRRLKVDCSLTIAKVLEQVSVTDVLNALPPGAASDPATILREVGDGHSGANAGNAEAAITSRAGMGICHSGDKLPRLDVMTKVQEWLKEGPSFAGH